LLTGVLAAVFLAAVFSTGTFVAAAFFTGAEVGTGGVAGVVADFLAGIMRKGCG
jgi:ABC-type spermidine/putrescine transport system permease subunit II